MCHVDGGWRRVGEDLLGAWKCCNSACCYLYLPHLRLCDARLGGSLPHPALARLDWAAFQMRGSGLSDGTARARAESFVGLPGRRLSWSGAFLCVSLGNYIYQ